MEMPDDIWRAARQFMDQYNQGGFAPDTIIATAILAERQRCANVADLYLHAAQVKEAILSGDKP